MASLFSCLADAFAASRLCTQAGASNAAFPTGAGLHSFATQRRTRLSFLPTSR